MNPRARALIGLLACSPAALASPTGDNLTQARAEYRQSVTQHGENSAEAKSARKNLRAARRAFHNNRRQNSRQHHDPRPR